MSTGKNIGLVGYYGFGNYGDEYFRIIFEKAFSDCNIKVITGYPDRVKSTQVRSDVLDQDAIIIGGGDLAIPFSFSAAYWRPEYLERPVYIHSIGVPTWGGYDEKSVLKMRQFFQHDNVRRVSARDIKSRDWIVKYLQPKVETVYEPDMVCSADPVTVEPVKNRVGVILRQQPNVPNPEHFDYLNQTIRDAGKDPYYLVLGTDSTRTDDWQHMLRIPLADADFAVRSDISSLTQALLSCERVLSMKFHGCVVALANNRPCMGLSSSDKFVSFYQMVDRLQWMAPFAHKNFVSALHAVMQADGFTFDEDLRQAARDGLTRLRSSILGN